MQKHNQVLVHCFVSRGPYLRGGLSTIRQQKRISRIGTEVQGSRKARADLVVRVERDVQEHLKWYGKGQHE